jgi:hypothetical protein
MLLLSVNTLQAQIPSEPQPQPVRSKLSFFPTLLNSIDVAGLVSFEFGQTFCPQNTALLPGLVPGSRPIMDFSGSAISGALKTYLQLKMYYDQWDKLQVPLLKFDMYHEILSVNLGDFYESMDP